MTLTLVCNPEDRRTKMFAEAARGRGVEVDLVTWLEALAQTSVRGDVRIESPGENWEVESRLLGVDEPLDLGRLRPLAVANAAMVRAMNTFGGTRYMSTPAAIAAMFDKVESKRRFAAAGLLVPETFGIVRTFDELRKVGRSARRRRFFVKPRHASSAAGVVALTMSEDRVLATTSVEVAGERLYNSLRIRRYETFEDVAALVNLLGGLDELIVEDWIPKASAQRATFDLRLLAIGDRADHAVMRLSRSPMTNLHLGNSRGDLERLRSDLGDHWTRIQEAAVRALDAFDGALYGGVDIVLSSRSLRIVVLEINAFGDLLPGVTDQYGRSTYEAELDAFLAA